MGCHKCLRSFKKLFPIAAQNQASVDKLFLCFCGQKCRVRTGYWLFVDMLTSQILKTMGLRKRPYILNSNDWCHLAEQEQVSACPSPGFLPISKSNSNRPEFINYLNNSLHRLFSEVCFKMVGTHVLQQKYYCYQIIFDTICIRVKYSHSFLKYKYVENT